MRDGRIPTALVWVVLVICVMPFLLNLSVLVSISPAASFGKPKRIGVIQTSGPSSAAVILDALVQKMRTSGYVKGRDYELIVRAVPLDIERIYKVAKELESEGIELLITIGTKYLIGSVRATTNVPIVSLLTGVIFDLKEAAKSLEAPGDRVTGIYGFIPWGKFMEYATTFLPGLRRLGILVDTKNQAMVKNVDRILGWARKMNLIVSRRDIRSPQEIPEKIRALSSRADLLIILSVRGYKSIREFAVQSPVPVSSHLKRYLNESLFTYTIDNRSLGTQAGKIVVDILEGVPPAIIPIEKPARYFLTINKRVANRLGISLDRKRLRLAQRVIE